MVSGDGPDGVVMPDSRRNERLFGHYGRSSYRSAGVKLENLEDDYCAEDDTCIKAFVRLIAIAAAAAAARRRMHDTFACPCVFEP